MASIECWFIIDTEILDDCSIEFISLVQGNVLEALVYNVNIILV